MLLISFAKYPCLLTVLHPAGYGLAFLLSRRCQDLQFCTSIYLLSHSLTTFHSTGLRDFWCCYHFRHRELVFHPRGEMASQGASTTCIACCRSAGDSKGELNRARIAKICLPGVGSKAHYVHFFLVDNTESIYVRKVPNPEVRDMRLPRLRSKCACQPRLPWLVTAPATHLFRSIHAEYRGVFLTNKHFVLPRQGTLAYRLVTIGGQLASIRMPILWKCLGKLIEGGT